MCYLIVWNMYHIGMVRIEYVSAADRIVPALRQAWHMVVESEIQSL